ncbi:LolA family protein [Saccharothrix sp. Mg75]|uniref:LolA family protein n=1 Tax=Saccharothrix sp. Mg75 TaxID=3445357 RepID=UPI003EEC95BE
MNRRRVTVVAAAVGVVAGVAGLGVLAMPAGAGQAPVLPEVGAEALVESVVTAGPAAFGGTVEVSNDLGVPAVPGVPQLSDGDSAVRLWSDGAGRVRAQLPAGNSERTFVDDGTTGWLWNSAEQAVNKFPHGAAPPQEAAAADPVAVAREVVTRLREFSDVTVDGTARVANRPVYELVLSPKPTEKTVLREVRVAVDSELRVPLRVAVLTNGTNAPAVQIGFSELNVGPQDAALFSFTPPAGATVTEAKPEGPSGHDRAAAEQALAEANPQVIGEGWDVVLGARVPGGALAAFERQEPSGDRRDRGFEGRPGAGDVDVQGLLEQLGKEVGGTWGSGTLITTRVGGVLIADDGRVAAGAVPEQVLLDAIGQVK